VVRDTNGDIILPENPASDLSALEQRIKKTTYHFFTPNKLDYITNEEQLIPDVSLPELDYSQFIPVMNAGAEKIRSIEAKESNYFNILQNIAETFEAWLDFEITRDKDGTGAITGKKVVFRNYTGKKNPVGFRYGINLKDIQRTFESKQIVTKLIVKRNSNEFADGGFCTIVRAGANPTGETYIYDFQYFFNRGLLNVRDYLETLYVMPDDGEIGTLQGYFPRIKACNRGIDEAND
jgi:hypothetical protein